MRGARMAAVAMGIVAAVLLALAARPAAALPAVSIEPAFEHGRPVKSREFVTVPFNVQNHSASTETLTIVIDSGGGASLISSIEPVEFGPGETKKAPFTFLIAADAGQGTDIPVKAGLLIGDSARAVASARSHFTVDEKICASLEKVPDVLSLIGKQKNNIDIAITNCGSSAGGFSLDIRSHKDIIIREKPGEIEIEPGETRGAEIVLFPNTDMRDDTKLITLEVRAKNMSVAEKTSRISIMPPERRNVSGYFQFLRLRMKAEHTVEGGREPRTTFKLSIPEIHDRGISYRSDMDLDLDDGSPRTRRNTHELHFNRNSIVSGNQDIRFSDMLVGNTSHEGFRYSRKMAGGALSFFSGEGGRGDVRYLKYEKEIDEGLHLSAGRMTRAAGAGHKAGAAADVLTFDYEKDRRTYFAGELVRSDTRSSVPQAAGTGFGAQLKGRYTRGPLQFNATVRRSSSNTPADYYHSISDFDIEYEALGSRFTLASHRRVSHSLRNGGSGGYSLIPVEQRHLSLGWSKYMPGPELSMSASLHSRSVDVRAAGAAQADSSNVKTASLSASKNFSGLGITASYEQGREASGGAAGGSSQYHLSGRYRTGRLSARAGFTKAIDFAAEELACRTRRTRFLSLKYLLPGSGSSFYVDWKKETDAFAGRPGGAGVRTTLGFRKTLGGGDFLNLEYEMLRGGAAADSRFKASYSRSFEANIPYRKNGSVSGAVFIDHDRDGGYGGADTPLEGAMIRLGGEYTAMTDSNGFYEIDNVPPGEYGIEIDSSSFAVGISKSGAAPRAARVSAGAQTEVEIPFLSLYTITGCVAVDYSNYFAKMKGLSPGGLRVTLEDRAGEVREAFTDGAGGYYFENLEPGRYVVMLDTGWLPQNVHAVGDTAYAVVAGAEIQEDGRRAFSTPGLAAAYSFARGMAAGLRGSGSEDGARDALTPENTIYCENSSDCGGADFMIGLEQKTIIKTFGD